MVDELTMPRYRDWSPTCLDPVGLNADSGLGDFFVFPVSRTRDSDLLTESNFDAALKALGGESKSVQVHRFGHWGPGWFEIILISPRATKKLAIAEELICSLSDYPVLDEEDNSRREYEDTIKNIESELRHIGKTLPDDIAGKVFSWLWDNEQREVESVDGGGGYPSEQAIRRALVDMGYVHNIEDYAGAIYIEFDDGINALVEGELDDDSLNLLDDLYSVVVELPDRMQMYLVQSDCPETALDNVSRFLDGKYLRAETPKKV